MFDMSEIHIYLTSIKQPTRMFHRKLCNCASVILLCTFEIT